MSSTTLITTAAHSTDAERTVIGALLLDPDAIFQVVQQLTAADFYDPTYKAIYDAICDLMEQGTAVDFVTVSNAMQQAGSLDKIGGSAFLAQTAAEVPTASHIMTYAKIILEKSRRRRLETIGRKIAGLAQEDKRPADELIEIAEQEFLQLSRQGTAELTPLRDMRSERFEHYTRLYEGDDPNLQGLRTGYRDLDLKLTAFAPGELIVLAARPGMGKTVMALDIARDVAVGQGKAVAFFSLEMSKEQVFDRLFAADLPVEAWKLGKGHLTSEQFDAMGQVFDRFADYPLFIDDDCNTDLVNIRSKARRHQMQHGLDLLIIDYLGLIEVTDRLAGDTLYQRITYISKSLKRLARELHCPILALSQLSRECEKRTDKRPQLSDLRDSGSIEQDGDKILMLYREGEYDEDCEDPDCTDIFIRKHRNGPTGSIELRFDRRTMRFSDYDRS